MKDRSTLTSTNCILHRATLCFTKLSLVLVIINLEVLLFPILDSC
jgi:hypothetical protein